MDNQAEENPFASPSVVHIREAPKPPVFTIGVSPIDIRGICSVCAAAAPHDCEQRYRIAKLIVRYSLCEHCLWRRKWQRLQAFFENMIIYGLFSLLIWIPIFALIALTDFLFSSSYRDGIRTGEWSVIAHLFGIGVLIVTSILLRIPCVFFQPPVSKENGIYQVFPRAPTFEAALRDHREASA